MPFVLQNTSTAQVYTCMLVNHYQLAYYGVKFWDHREDAEQQRVTFLQEKGITEPEDWLVVEMEEGQMKISNVKLKNDPGFLLYWNEHEKPLVKKV